MPYSYTLSMLEHGQKFYYQRLHHAERATAYLHSTYANAHRKEHTDPAPLEKFELYRPTVQELSGNPLQESTLTEDDAIALFSLSQKRLPAFCMAALSIEEKHRWMAKAENEWDLNTVEEITCWTAPGIALINPKVDDTGEFLKAQLLFVDWGFSRSQQKLYDFYSSNPVGVTIEVLEEFCDREAEAVFRQVEIPIVKI